MNYEYLKGLLYSDSALAQAVTKLLTPGAEVLILKKDQHFRRPLDDDEFDFRAAYRGLRADIPRLEAQLGTDFAGSVCRCVYLVSDPRGIAPEVDPYRCPDGYWHADWIVGQDGFGDFVFANIEYAHLFGVFPLGSARCDFTALEGVVFSVFDGAGYALLDFRTGQSTAK